MSSKNKLILQDTFEIEIKTLYEQFRDFQKYGNQHPVMKDVKVVEDKSPDYIEYEINEEVLIFGIIKIYPNYKAKVIEIEKYKHLRYTSQVKRNISLIIDLHFTEENGKTLMVENIAVKANIITTIVFFDILKKAHTKLFQNIKHNFKK